MEHPKTERGPLPARGDRFYCIGNDWFFSTRAGQTHGPFDSREEANAALALFLTALPKGKR